MSRTRNTADLVSLNAIHATGGRVGIGTTARSNQFYVDGNTQIVGVVTASGFVGDLTGNADTSTQLETARNIGGVSFDGTADINLPGVNTTGNQDTSGNAGTATSLATARTIHGVSFDGTSNIDLSEVIQDTVGAMFSSNTETDITVTYEDSDGTIDLVVGTLNQDTTGTAALAEGLTGTPSIVVGVVTASSLDISGNVDVDGTLEADAITIDGVTLSETIADTVGAMVSSNTETNISVTYDDSDNTLDFVIGTLNQDTTGNAGTATSLATARTIGGVSFDGTSNIDLPGVNTAGNQDTSGNAATATTLATARTIAGVSFDGSQNISLNNNAITNGAGYITTSFTNTNQLTNGAGFITASDDITGNAATATQLETARNIGGVSFDGTADINLPGVNAAGNQNTSGTAAGLSGAPSIIVTDITAVGNVSIAGTLTYEDVKSVDSLGIVTARTGVRVTTGGLIVSAGGASITGVTTSSGGFVGDLTGNADTATRLATARLLGGVTFDGTGNINLPGVNVTGNQDTTGNAGTATSLATARTIAGVSFDGTANISLNNNAITNGAGYITTSFTNTNQLTNGAGFITASDDITGNAGTATSLATARTIAGVSFDGTSNISLNNNAITNGAGYITTSFTNTNQLVNGAGFITNSVTGNFNVTGIGTITNGLNVTGGNVGIGLTDPSHMLHLKSTGDARIHIQADSDNSGENDNPRISFSQDGSSDTWLFQIGLEGYAGATMNGSLANAPIISADNGNVNAPIQIGHLQETVMTICNASYNAAVPRVGIGSNRPSSALDVVGDVNVTGILTATTLSGDLSATNVTATNVTAGIATVSTAFYMPQYTTNARDAGSFNEGAMIYNTTTKKMEFYDGTNWNTLPGMTIGLTVALDS